MLERLVRLISFVPIITVIAVVSLLLWRGATGQNRIAEKYRNAARNAMAEDDLEQAKFYYSRLVGAGDRGTDQDQLNWVAILSAAGDVQGVIEQLDRLAPDDQAGFPPAHLEKAKMLAEEQRRTGELDSQRLKMIGWHLKHGARESNTQNDLLWADYYLALNQLDDASQRLTSAASREPSLWFSAAAVFRKHGRKREADQAVERAAKYAIAQLKEDPTNVSQRLRLADLLAQKEHYDEVRKLLGEGIRLMPNDPAIRRAASTYALIELNRIDPASKDAELRKIRLLAQAGELDPTNPRLYNELSLMVTRAQSQEERDQYRKQLEAWISEGQEVAHAHFAMGNLVWVDTGDFEKAAFHFQTAMEIDPKMLPVANNLAWVIAHSKDGDLERAEQLARIAYDANPDLPSYNDTLATILMKREKYRDALPLFEKILQFASVEKKVEIRKQLVTIYEKLGQPEMARIHRKQISGGDNAP